jgi:LysM repeat protein
MYIIFESKNKRIKQFFAAIIIFMILLASGIYSYAETTYAPIDYIIKPGDTLDHLALRFNTSVEDIRNLNPEIIPENLRVYTKIKINPPSDLHLHHIKWGDTLWKIAREYGFTVKNIADKNFVSNPDLIYAGDVLVIPITQTVTLYYIKSTETDFYLVPETRKVIADVGIYKNTLEELIKGPSTTTGTFMPIPKTTKVLGVAVKNGIAYPNFSDDIYRSNVGSSSEAFTLMALANTLTEFPEITGVYPLVNGNPIGTLGGHIEIEEPLTRAESVIRR